MTALLAKSSRLRAVAMLSLILMLVGTAAAAAYWTATAQVNGAASAASVGLAQNADGATGLDDIIYSATDLTAAGTLQIKNVGSRDATYAVDLRSESATADGLEEAITVTAAPVANLEKCASGTALADARTGSMPYTLEGTIQAGQTVVLCLQSTLSPDAVTDFGGQELELSISSSLRYAVGDAWTVSAGAQRVTQAVAAAPPVEEPQIDNGTELFCGEQGSAPYSLRIGFPQVEGQQGEVTYRVFIAPEATPNQRVEVKGKRPTGWNTAVQFDHGDKELQTYVNSPQGGWGNTWVFIEQQMQGSDQWTSTAYAKVRLVELPWNEKGVGIECGWQE